MNSRFDITPEQYHAGLDKLWTALDITTVQDEDVFTLAARAIKDAKTLKEYRIRVYIRHKGCSDQVDKNGPSKDYKISAYNEIDARLMAYSFSLKFRVKSLNASHILLARKWTEVIPKPKPTATDYAKLVTSEFHMTRLVRCQRKYGNLKRVDIYPCQHFSCSRCIAREWYPSTLGCGRTEQIEIESIAAAKDLYLNVFGSLTIHMLVRNTDSIDQSDNFIVHDSSMYCEEHSCPK